MHEYKPDDVVLCLDDSNHAHFLKRGRTFIVESTQTDSLGGLRLNLVGMARAWEAERFAPVLATDFGGRLRVLREASQLSQGRLASRSGLHVQQISDIERGKVASPGWQTVVRLAAALHISPDRFLSE